MVLQLDPLDHHFDPEGQAPTLWTSTSWSTGSEGRFQMLSISFHLLSIAFHGGSGEMERINWRV
jgi:hypothetical protein